MALASSSFFNLRSASKSLENVGIEIFLSHATLSSVGEASNPQEMERGLVQPACSTFCLSRGLSPCRGSRPGGGERSFRDSVNPGLVRWRLLSLVTDPREPIKKVMIRKPKTTKGPNVAILPAQKEDSRKNTRSTRHGQVFAPIIPWFSFKPRHSPQGGVLRLQIPKREYSGPNELSLTKAWCRTPSHW